jgi:hypothetical protein
VSVCVGAENREFQQNFERGGTGSRFISSRCAVGRSWYLEVVRSSVDISWCEEQAGNGFAMPKNPIIRVSLESSGKMYVYHPCMTGPRISANKPIFYIDGHTFLHVGSRNTFP